MSLELEIYTGVLTYKEIEFSYMFDSATLRLIPPKDKHQEINGWLRQSLSVGMYLGREPYYIEDEYLKGICNETGQTMIFIPKKQQVGCYNCALTIEVEAYVIEKYYREWIDRVSFECRELDGIFDTERCIEKNEWSNKGIINVITKDFDATTSKPQVFNVDGKEISVYFGITRRREKVFNGSLLTVHSVLYFEFKKTNNFLFVLKLWKYAKVFIQFLCYRENVWMGKTVIAAPADQGLHEPFAELTVVENKMEEDKKILEQRRCISQELIAGCEGKMLTDVSNGNLYLRHLPKSHKDGLRIDAARFVMITAAFEWEFRRCYPEGIIKKESTKVVEEKATSELQKLIDGSTGKLRNKYKFLQKLIKSDPLQSEISQVGKDYDGIIGGFGKNLYSRNNVELNYNEMGERLADQRNHFAHGDLDQEFIGSSLLDLIFLEYIIYAMQLKYYGVSDENIRNAINDLFHLNYRF
ncbi:MAG: hypothetical protein KH356_28965 [Lachnospiraceae bacterium]|nr:hypothetical protein [Lachnospiraceae bacterium]